MKNKIYLGIAIGLLYISQAYTIWKIKDNDSLVIANVKFTFQGLHEFTKQQAEILAKIEKFEKIFGQIANIMEYHGDFIGQHDQFQRAYSEAFTKNLKMWDMHRKQHIGENRHFLRR